MKEEKVYCCCDLCGNDIYDGDPYYCIGISAGNHGKELNICEDCIADCQTWAPDDDEYECYEADLRFDISRDRAMED